jgi:hypothetical protein
MMGGRESLKRINGERESEGERERREERGETGIFCGGFWVAFKTIRLQM